MMKRLLNRAERKSYDELDRDEQVCIYLRDHPECLTERLMADVAARFMNYAYIRMRIKELYPKIILENLLKDNFVIIQDKI